MDNAKLLATFKVHQERRGHLPGSIIARQRHLRTFTRWLDGRSMLEATREDIEAFLDVRPIGNKTRYGYLSHLHCFYSWAIMEEIATADPTARILRPRLRRMLPRPAATDELAAAVAVADPRLRCWIVLAAYQGLRCQEIAGLRREDVLEADGLLRVVHGKGAKERLLPLHAEVLAALRALPLPRQGWVFLRAQGGRYTPAQLSRRFVEDLRDNGVDAVPHQLRHWFGTNLYAATGDLRVTQEMLGHSNPATTAIYTAFDQRAAAVGVGSLSFGGKIPA